mgnify:CR=1 FL=1
MKIDLITGARPNFMKVAPIIDAIKIAQSHGKNIKYRLVHTGQHYDKNMSGSFFEQLGIPLPDVNLEVGSGSQAEQTAKIMVMYESLLLKESADYCLVVGDVTSTMACSIVAKKMNIKVVHVEGGIRSWDLTMPEEINRMVTDSITDYFFTTSKNAGQNLIKTGVPKKNIFFVGNTMIDTLLRQKNNFKKPNIFKKLNLQRSQYIMMTLHRPANVDEENNLIEIINEIVKNSNRLPVIFPVHPRTKKVLEKLKISFNNLYLIDPMSYLEFNYLVSNCKVVITDSGGITEEATVLNIPSMTLRDNTERPETIEIGTNELLGTDSKAIEPAMKKLFSGNWKKGSIPEKWDGKAGNRIIKNLLNIFNK